MVQPGDGIISVGQAADILGYSPQHVRYLIRRSAIDATRIGKIWAISKDSVNRMLRQQENSSLFAESRRGRPRRAATMGKR
jgi:excisionase family DNA binding protein